MHSNYVLSASCTLGHCAFNNGRVLCYEGKIAADKVFSKPTVKSLDKRGKGSSSGEGCISGTFFCSPNSKSILTCDGQVVVNFSATCDPGYCIDNEQVFCQLLKTIAYNAVSTLSTKSLGGRGKKSTSNDGCIPGTYSCNYENLVLVWDALGHL